MSETLHAHNLYASSMRVLGRLRLSRSTDESTSIERQREVIEGWAKTFDHTIVGWAEDVDVSGSIDPFETKQLGEWLNKRAGEWDTVAAWKLDRLGRNAIQLNKLFGWAARHDKTIVSCSENFDLSTWVGRLVANVIAGVAEGELEAIRERTRSSRRKLRESARWAGGKPPYGYAAVKLPAGQGWTLEIDPVASKIVRRIIEEVLDGKPVTRLANELNKEGVPTPGDYYRGTTGGKWAATPIKAMLRSRSLRGHVHHAGETVRDEDGAALTLAEPLLSLDEWELIQERLDTIQQSRAWIPPPEESPLSGIAHCLVCETVLHHDRNAVKGYVYRYYRCRNKDTTMIPAEVLESLAEEAFLYELADEPVRERVWVPGDSQSDDLREAVTAFEELTKAAGRITSTTGKRRLQSQLDVLDSRIAALESAQSQDARWEYQTTGGTYGSVWQQSDVDGRRELLKRSGITVAMSITGVVGNRSASNAGVQRFEIRIPEEIKQRMGEK